MLLAPSQEAPEAVRVSGTRQKSGCQGLEGGKGELVGSGVVSACVRMSSAGNGQR